MGLAAVNAALFMLSGLTAHSSRHSGTVSDVLWMDFLLGVLLLAVLVVATAVRSAFALRR
jgi:hypothetical protein